MDKRRGPQTRGPILVMRYAPLLGYSGGRKLVTVAARCWTVDAALRATRRLDPAAYWLAEVRRPAHG